MKILFASLVVLQSIFINSFVVKLKEKKILSPVREHPVDEILYLT